MEMKLKARSHWDSSPVTSEVAGSSPVGSAILRSGCFSSLKGNRFAISRSPNLKSQAMIPVADAIQIVLDQTTSLRAESVALVDSRGRILAEDIVADCDLPPFDRAQMDGYAIRAADVANTPARLRIVGESAAGNGWHHEMKAGEAVRIMTGAPVPPGADAVQQVEVTRELNDGAIVEILEPVDPGRSIVRRAAEIKAGEIVLSAGEQIRAETIAT